MKTVFTAAAVAALAGSAFANIDRSLYTIYSDAAVTAVDIRQAGDDASRSFTGVSYSNLTSDVEGFFSQSLTTPDGDGAPTPLDFDDYQSIAPGNAFLDEFGFVGGVDTVGGVVFFDIFDAGGAPVDGFGVALASAGNFIYTIDITNNDVLVPAGGFVQMSVDDDGAFGPATGASWFLTADDATVGDNLGAGFTSPAGNDLNYAFELVTIPTPGAAGLLGLAGLAAIRRRR